MHNNGKEELVIHITRQGEGGTPTHTYNGGGNKNWVGVIQQNWGT